MGSLIRWQVLIALSGIALVGAFLFSYALARTTVLVPAEGGVYIEGVAGVPQHLNPLLAAYNQVDQDLAALIFNGLTRLNAQGEVEPDLASSWTVTPDGLTYLFRLRQDVRWADGERFDADDVLFTIQLLQDPDSPAPPDLVALWRTIRVEKIDPYTVRFRLEQPFPAFLDYTNISILPHHILRGVPIQELPTHRFNTYPVGTGPFMVAEISTRRARLVPNPRHFARKQPYLEALEIHFYPSYEQLPTAYKQGDILGLSYVPPYLFPEVSRFPELNLYSARTSGFYLVYLNLQDDERSSFLQDERVRKALLYGLDRQSLIDQALHGQGIVSDGPIRPWSWAYAPDVPSVPYDLVRAEQLLDEARWIDSDGDGVRDKKGKSLRFTLLCSEDPDHIALAQALAQQWAALEIAVEVETLGGELVERLRTHDFQAALAEVVISGDPDPYPMWDQTQIERGQNYGGWDNSEASRLLAEARRTVDREERKILYTEFQRIFAEELPALILADAVYTYAVDASVRQVQLAPLMSPADRFRTIADWYMNMRRVIVVEKSRRFGSVSFPP
ncbi:MAG: ABC transporter substrate-binding protein [Anaerolineae bacterium]